MTQSQTIAAKALSKYRQRPWFYPLKKKGKLKWFKPAPFIHKPPVIGTFIIKIPFQNGSMATLEIPNNYSSMDIEIILAQLNVIGMSITPKPVQP